jgi:hypothetical protein
MPFVFKMFLPPTLHIMFRSLETKITFFAMWSQTLLIENVKQKNSFFVSTYIISGLILRGKHREKIRCHSILIPFEKSINGSLV